MNAGTALSQPRRLLSSARPLLVLLAAALVTASCAAGTHAQTAAVKPGIDVAYGQAGDVLLLGVAIHAPTSGSYRNGANVQVSITLVNNGHKSDTLVNVSAPSFTGWGIVNNSVATTASTGSVSGDTGLTISPGTAQRLSLADQGASATASPRSLLLTGYKSSTPLYPGEAVEVTFRFANAGSTTLRVPVQLVEGKAGETLPAGQGATDSAG